MNKSESIAELLKAVSVFQGELENVEKGKDGHGYKYATLGACIDSAKPILKSNDLSVIQLMGDDGNGNATLETVLGHSSGEYISTVCVIPIAKLAGGGANNPAQVMGASVTYIRRYQFAAIIGLAQDDDDAASATHGTAKHRDDKSWYNDFEAQKQLMVDKIRSGESTTQEIIKNLRLKYKVSKQVVEQIEGLK